MTLARRELLAPPFLARARGGVLKWFIAVVVSATRGAAALVFSVVAVAVAAWVVEGVLVASVFDSFWMSLRCAERSAFSCRCDF